MDSAVGMVEGGSVFGWAQPSTGKLLVDEQEFRTWESSHDFVVNGTVEQADSSHAAERQRQRQSGMEVRSCCGL